MVAVRTGLFGKKESFVPLQDATLEGDRLEVPFAKDKVKHAPSIDQDGQLSPDDEDELYRYYGSGRADDDDDQRDDAGPRQDDSDAATRSPAGKARLRKYVDEQKDDKAGEADEAGEAPEMILYEERPVVTMQRVPVEKVRLRTDTVAGEETVTGEVRKERIELEDDKGRRPLD